MDEKNEMKKVGENIMYVWWFERIMALIRNDAVRRSGLVRESVVLWGGL